MKRFLLFITIVNLTACSTLNKIDKPNPVGTTRFVGGYCLAISMNTLEVTNIYTPTECDKVMSGEGFFYPSGELKKLLTFGNKICDQSGMCNKDLQKAENEKFLEFLNKPEELKKFLKEKAKE